MTSTMYKLFTHDLRSPIVLPPNSFSHWWHRAVHVVIFWFIAYEFGFERYYWRDLRHADCSRIIQFQRDTLRYHYPIFEQHSAAADYYDHVPCRGDYDEPAQRNDRDTVQPNAGGHWRNRAIDRK